MSARPVRRRQTIFVGSKIRQLRKERDLTQAELAQRIGVQQSDLCRMENGEYKVSLDTLFKILGVFGIDIGEFFREDRRPPVPATRSARSYGCSAARLARPGRGDRLPPLQGPRRNSIAWHGKIERTEREHLRSLVAGWRRGDPPR